VKRTWHDRDDSGMALPIVLGAVALLLILVTAGFYASSQVLFQAQKGSALNVAGQAASSGTAVAFADLNARLASPPAQMTYAGSLDSSAAAYVATATLNGAHTAYDCTSTGTAADGTVVTEVAQFTIDAGSGGTIWGKDVFYPGTMRGRFIVGEGMFSGPIYISFPGNTADNTLTFGSAASGFARGPIYIQNGNLVIKNDPPVTVDIYTNGTVNAQYPAKFVKHGWDASYAFTLVPVVTPTFLADAQQQATTQSSDNKMGYTASTVVNYESSPTATPASYTSLTTNPPNNRPTGWVRWLAPGAAQSYKVILGDLTIGNSTASFGSWSGDGHYPITSGLHDDFAYDSTSGVLYVEGIVYVNGNLVFSKPIQYVGGGTIVCAGAVTFNSSVVPDTANGSDGTPDPDANNILGVFSVGNVTVNTNGTVVIAAMYTCSQIDVTANNAILKGSFIAERGMTNFPNNLDLISIPAIGGYAPQALPTGQTGTGGGSGTLTLRQTAWRRM